MKFSLPFQKTKYRAATTTRREYVDEPDMKLSSAFVVVLVLHLVAIGGIYAFTSIKAHQPPENIVPDSHAAAKSDATEESPASNLLPAKLQHTKAPELPVKAGKPAPIDPRKVKETKPAGPKDSGEIHVVAKGENPVAIARKLHVNYDDLLKLNKIDDPKRLKIGQKLRIPTKDQK